MFHPGEPVAMPRRADRQRPTTHLLVTGWPHPSLPVLAREFAVARSHGTFTALDAGPILGRPWSRKALRPVLAELICFSPTSTRPTASPGRRTCPPRSRLRRDCPGHVVIKRGGKGATWLPRREERAHHLPRHRVRVVNTVGAGDSFNGGLLGALARGEGLPRR